MDDLIGHCTVVSGKLLRCHRQLTALGHSSKTNVVGELLYGNDQLRLCKHKLQAAFGPVFGQFVTEHVVIAIMDTGQMTDRAAGTSKATVSYTSYMMMTA